MVGLSLSGTVNARQTECSKCKMVGHYAAMGKTKTRGGTANSLGGRKCEAEVNQYLKEVVVDDTDDDDDDDEALGLFTAEIPEKRGMHQFKCQC